MTFGSRSPHFGSACARITALPLLGPGSVVNHLQIPVLPALCHSSRLAHRLHTFICLCAVETNFRFSCASKSAVTQLTSS